MESKKIEFFNKLSFITLLATIFLSLFFFIPYSPVTLEASKGFLLSIGATLSIFFWFISRLGDGKFLIPKDKLMFFALIIPVIFLLSSFFSSSFYISLFGGAFEIGTFGSMLVLSIIFFLSSIYFQSERRLWYFIMSLFIGGIIVVLFELLNIFIGFNNILPGLFQGVSYGNLVGNWNNFALVIGIMVLLSLFTLELFKTNKLFKIIQYFLLLFGIILLMIVNVSLVWFLIGSFSIILFVYIVSLQHSGVNVVQNEDNKKNFPFISLVVILVSLVFLISGNIISTFTSQYINVNNTDIRPSIVTTSKIALKSIMHNPVLGTGPNTFVIDWSLWQPKEIAQTVFWNVDFTSGFSFLTTTAVSAGLIAFIALLLFFVIYVIRGIQSIRIALRDRVSNYFIMTTLMISIYSWITVILYNPNNIMLMLAFASSGMLISILVYKQAVPVKEFSFLSDPRNSFFAILILLALMISAIFLSYIYIEKFTSILYFSKSLNTNNTMESLSRSETMLLKAITLDKNDVYYRNLSQLYLSEINLLVNNKDISSDTLKSNLQGLINLTQQSANLAIDQNPKQYLNYMNLGNIYTALVPLSVENSYKSALSSYDKASLLAPNNPFVVLSKATLEFINKNNEEARKYIQEALVLKQNYIDAIFLLVQIETNEGNLSEAIKQAEYAGGLAPNDSTVFFRLGLLRYNNSDYRGAVSAFEKAVNLNSNYINARYYLGLSYKKIGRINDALLEFNYLDKLIPDNQEIKDAISSVNIQEVSNDIDNSTGDNNTKPPLKEKQ